MDLFDIVRACVPYVLGAVIGYLVYNHKRHDKNEKDILVLRTEMDGIKEDIRDIKEGVNYLIHKKE